MILVYF